MGGQIEGDQLVAPRCNHVAALRHDGIALVREPAVHADNGPPTGPSPPQGGDSVKDEFLRLGAHESSLLQSQNSVDSKSSSDSYEETFILGTPCHSAVNDCRD